MYINEVNIRIKVLRINQMDHSREIASLKRRALKVSQKICPPTLKMPIYFEGEEGPEASQWCLPLMIEKKTALS